MDDNSWLQSSGATLVAPTSSAGLSDTAKLRPVAAGLRAGIEGTLRVLLEEEVRMPDWLIIVIVVAALIVLGVIAFAVSKRARAKNEERQREKATEHRDEAQLRAREAGEAELQASRYAEEAQRQRERAEELDRKAAETDPGSGSEGRPGHRAE